MKQLVEYIHMEVEKFRQMGEFTLTDPKSGSGYTFIDNDASILAVGHIDYMQPGKWANNYTWDFKLKKLVKVNTPKSNGRIAAKFWKNKSGEVNVESIALDDRLGCYIITEGFACAGIKADVLLTEDEESGCSTGEYFETDKEYNWIVEFDRRGYDVVLYQYGDAAMRELVKSYGFEVGFGTFSDISEMEHLKIKAFNFGTGYYHAHTKSCTANLSDVAIQIGRFRDFYNDNKDTKFEHTPSPYYGHWKGYGWGDGYGAASYNSWMDDYAPPAVLPATSKAPKIEINRHNMGELIGLCYHCNGDLFELDEIYGDCAMCGSPINNGVMKRLAEAGQVLCYGECGAMVTPIQEEKQAGFCDGCWDYIYDDEVEVTIT